MPSSARARCSRARARARSCSSPTARPPAGACSSGKTGGLEHRRGLADREVRLRRGEVARHESARCAPAATRAAATARLHADRGDRRLRLAGAGADACCWARCPARRDRCAGPAMPGAPRCMRSRCSTRSASARRCEPGQRDGDSRTAAIAGRCDRAVDRRHCAATARVDPAAPRMLELQLAVQWGDGGPASACSCARCAGGAGARRCCHERRRHAAARAASGSAWLHPDRSVAGDGAAGRRPGARIRHVGRGHQHRQPRRGHRAAQRTHARGRGLPAHAPHRDARRFRSPSTTASALPQRFIGEPDRMRFVADLPDYLGRGGPYLHDFDRRSDGATAIRSR